MVIVGIPLFSSSSILISYPISPTIPFNLPFSVHLLLSLPFFHTMFKSVISPPLRIRSSLYFLHSPFSFLSMNKLFLHFLPFLISFRLLFLLFLYSYLLLTSSFPYNIPSHLTHSLHSLSPNQ